MPSNNTWKRLKTGKRLDKHWFISCQKGVGLGKLRRTECTMQVHASCTYVQCLQGCRILEFAHCTEVTKLLTSYTRLQQSYVHTVQPYTCLTLCPFGPMPICSLSLQECFKQFLLNPASSTILHVYFMHLFPLLLFL